MIPTLPAGSTWLLVAAAGAAPTLHPTGITNKFINTKADRLCFFIEVSALAASGRHTAEPLVVCVGSAASRLRPLRVYLAAVRKRSSS